MPRKRLTSALLAVVGLALAAAVPVVISAVTQPAHADSAVTDATSDFEDGTVQGWGPRNTEVLANSTTVAHGGTHSLSITGRTAAWNGPSLSLLGTMVEGTQYTLSVWVQLAAGETSTAMRLSMERQLSGVASYDTIVNSVTASAGSWVQLTGTYTLATTVDVLKVYVETVSGTPSFYIDDFSMTHVPAVPIQTGLPNLKDVMAPYFSIGAAVDPATILGEHAQLLEKHFNSITPGNALKWDATEPTEGTFNFTTGDSIVSFAIANGIKVRGHTLAWYNQTPAWVFLDASGNTMTATAANKTLLLSRLQAHINAVVGHYKGELYAWDVVNEALNDDGTFRNSMWYQITGTDYITDAFTWAHAADPSAELCINDYNLTVAAKRDAMYNLVSSLKAAGIPVNCIGSQMHSNIAWPSAADTTSMIEKFATLGVDQQITEMDVSIYTDSTSSYSTVPASALTAQAAEYKALFDVYRSHAADISSVTLWGLADDDTWLDSFPITRLDAPLLFDQQLQAKSAYWSVIGDASPSAGTSPIASASPSPSTSASASPSASASASPSPSASASPSPSASASASPTAGASGSCAVAYTVPGQWTGGFQGDVKVTNTGTSTISGWTLKWTFANGQVITQLWNGTASQSGAAVTVANASYNGTLAAGTTVDVGFLASWTGTNAKPTAFTLKGTACTVS
jgi:endo-1,4-beta-xylanase